MTSAGTIINGIVLTRRETEIYYALTSEPDSPHAIGRRAGLTTMNMNETASRYCIALVRKGLAIKHGKPMFPKWSKA